MKLKKCFICLVLVIMCVFGFSLFSVKTNAITSVPTNQYLGSVDIPFDLNDPNGNFGYGQTMDFTMHYGIVSSSISNYYIGVVESEPHYYFSYELPVVYLYNYDNNIIDSYFFKNLTFTSGWHVENPFVLEMYGSILVNNYDYDLFVDNINNVSILFGYSLPSEYFNENDFGIASYTLKDDIEFVEDENAITFYSEGYIYTFLDSSYFELVILEVYGDIDSFNTFFELYCDYSFGFHYNFFIKSPFFNSLFKNVINWISNFLNFNFINTEDYNFSFMLNNHSFSVVYSNGVFHGLHDYDAFPYFDNIYSNYAFYYFPYYLQRAILDYEIVGTTSEQLKEQEIYYNQVIKDVEEEFYNKGFLEGNSEGFGTGYDYGYNIGYGNGIQEGSDGEFKLRTLLGAIFSFPLSVLTTGLNVELWGINVGNLLMFVFFTVLGYVLIKLILKFFGR